MVHNDIDVVIGGGVSIHTKDMEDYLLANGYNVYKNDLKGMRADNNQKMWALYGNKEMAYDIDRNPEEQPSIEEMTRKAIDKLSKNPNGFFLMVEGSKVDWAAHGNDPAWTPWLPISWHSIVPAVPHWSSHAITARLPLSSYPTTETAVSA